MKHWEKHELACTKFLKDKYGKYAEFIHIGGFDSNVNDILVTAPHNFFSIETKDCPAQCGQFVLIPNMNERKFVPGKNKLKHSAYTDMIIEYMNDHFDDFCNAGTKGKSIDLPYSILFGWIKETYRYKNVKFFMPNESLIPLERIDEYFDVSAIYRVKKSGSASPGKAEKKLIQNIYPDVYEEDRKLYSNHDHGEFSMNGRNFIFSKRDDRYEIRKLSNTKNANVIFTVFNPHPCHNDEFMRELTAH